MSAQLAPASLIRGEGAVHGGRAGMGFSLLSVKSKIAKNQKIEQLTFDVGNAALQIHQGAPAYYHVENKPRTHKIMIDFSQTLNTRFKENDLKKIFASSPFVKRSQMIFEPQTQTMSLILETKKPVALRVRSVNGLGRQTAQVVVDLVEESLMPKAAMKAKGGRAPVHKVIKR